MGKPPPENPLDIPDSTKQKVKYAARGMVVGQSTHVGYNGNQSVFAGESGKEAVLPLRSVNGVLGVNAEGMGAKISQDLHLHINAPNAQLGVEQAIERTINRIVDQATSKTLRVIYESARR